MVRLTIIFFGIIFTVNVWAQPFTQVVKSTGLPWLGNTKIATGDLDNDNDIDILLSGTDAFGNKVSGIYENKGDTSFLSFGAPILPVDNGAVAMADFNNDNYLDFIVSGWNSTNTKKVIQLFRNNKNKTFTQVPVPFDSIAYGNIHCFDFDRDGDIDVLISGRNNANKKICKIYRNNKNAQFSLVTGTGIAGLTDGGVAIADFNSDQLLDIAISGLDNGNNNVTNLYYQDNKGNFTVQNFSFTPLVFGDLVANDYNNDGQMDILLTGQDVLSNRITKIYENVGNGASFIDKPTNLAGIINGNIAFGDCNNDGQIDISITGDDGNSATSKRTYFYVNNNSSIFTTVSGLVDVANSRVSFFDFDNDKDLDILVSGFTLSTPVTILYRNNVSVTGLSPSPPTNLNYMAVNDSVKLSWNRSDDNNTQSSSLTYNIWLTTVKDSFNIITPQADTLSGYSRKSGYGRYQTTTTGWLKGFKENRYYWRTQALDNTFLASSFSGWNSFVVCKTLPIIKKDTSICFKSTISVTSGLSNETVQWSTKKNGLTTVTGHNYSQLILVNDTIIAKRTNSIGCQRSDTIMVSVRPLPQISLPTNFSQCFKSSYAFTLGTLQDNVTWFSNEGDLFIGNSITGKALKKDTIWAKITSTYGCINRDTVIIDTLPLPRFTLGTDTSICFGQQDITLSVNRNDTIDWYNRQTILGVNVNQITLTKLTIQDTIIAKAKDVRGCVFFDTIQVKLNQLPIAYAGTDTIICYDFKHVLGGLTDSIKTTYQYTWSPNIDLNNNLIPKPTSVTRNDKNYLLTVTDTKGCKDTNSVFVKVNPLSLINAGSDRDICIGDSTTLGGIPTAQNSLFPYRYLWSNTNLKESTQSNPIIKPTTSDTYLLIVSTRNCTPDSSEVIIKVNPIPITFTNPLDGDTTIGFNENAQIKVYGGIKYKWFPELGLNDPFVQSPFASPLQSTLYVVTVTDENGCKNTDSITVSIKNQLFIPNLFSPNGDTNNDSFMVLGTGIEELTLLVHDRYGEKVYDSGVIQNLKDKNWNGWDGTFKGEQMPSGAYYWSITGKFYDGKTINYNSSTIGTIYLFR